MLLSSLLDIAKAVPDFGSESDTNKNNTGGGIALDAGAIPDRNRISKFYKKDSDGVEEGSTRTKSEGLKTREENKPKESLGSQASPEKPNRLREFLDGPDIKFLRKKVPIWGYAAACTAHFVAAMTCIKDFVPESLRQTLGQVAAYASKLSTSFNYSMVALDSFANNESLDTIGKATDPLFVLPFASLDNIHLFRGWSAALAYILMGQRDKDVRTDTKVNNFTDHMKVLKNMSFKTLFSFDGWKNLGKILTKQKPDDGSLISFSGYVILVGTFLGTVFGGNARNIWNKVGGTIRNIGSVLSDIAAMLVGDRSAFMSGVWYIANAALDFVQRLLDTNTLEQQKTVDALNHFSLICNNIATWYLADTSTRMNEGNFKKEDIAAPVGA